ncbi:hypothetical protein [Pseudarthrobacter polychromogenes]|uniref:Uncharacterized protein n=1 Tax=Pseudarthrobacter polychromogenes TaxID=1676 RepID=A0ABQ1XCJ4_9MICC|nr:hypothetical protein [Pseudarthrobacter polychromogenes]GGG83729.1 hypothetical protein GCM10011577_01470 [Pseudarthrobacter polychromogenes]
MQPMADFIGELFGPSWTAQGVAAVISSGIALLAVGISSRVAWRQGVKTRQHVDEVDAKQAEREREFKGREHWWERFSWACVEFTADDEDRIKVGLIVLSDLATSSWASEGDKLLVASVLKELVDIAVEEGVYDSAEDESQ